MRTQYEQIFGQMQMIAQELKQRPRGSAEYAQALQAMQELQAQEQQMRQDPAFAEDMAKAMAKISVSKDDQGIWQHQNRIQQMGSTILPAESYQAGEIAGQVVQELDGSPQTANMYTPEGYIDPNANSGQLTAEQEAMLPARNPDGSVVRDSEGYMLNNAGERIDGWGSAARVDPNQMTGQGPFIAGQVPSGMDIDPGRYNPAAGAALGTAALGTTDLGKRYGVDVAAQVEAANKAGKKVGSGGAGFDWDEKKGAFVRR